MKQINDEYKVNVDIFEGPLDLLLYLIKKNEVDIYDIPISMISAQYVEYLEAMKTLNLDIAGDFLLMAATLAHIKSQMLVPTPLPDEEDGEMQDPRAGLVNQLLEYQKYKEAAKDLLERDLLNRDVFKRDAAKNGLEKPKESERELVEISIFNLVDVFSKLLTEMPENFPQEIYVERLTIRERISEIADIISAQESKMLKFTELFSDAKSKSSIIITFLAVLEMIRLALIRAFQGEEFGDINISATNNLLNGWEWENADEESN